MTNDPEITGFYTKEGSVRTLKVDTDLAKMARELQQLVAAQAGVPISSTFKPANPNQIVKIGVDMAGPALTFTPRKDDTTWNNGGPSAEEMLIMRLRCKPFDRIAVRHISAFCDSQTAVVMVVTPNGKAVMIEDDVNLYPSDTLITQLRLLMETNGGSNGSV